MCHVNVHQYLRTVEAIFTGNLDDFGSSILNLFYQEQEPNQDRTGSTTLVVMLPVSSKIMRWQQQQKYFPIPTFLSLLLFAKELELKKLNNKKKISNDKNFFLCTGTLYLHFRD